MVLFTFLDIKEREALSEEDFGDPKRRLFPVLTQEDVDKAPKRLLSVTDSDDIKTRITAIATKKGFTVPQEWSGVPVTASEFSDDTAKENKTTMAEFELDASTAQPTQDGEYVLRTGKIFEAGKYPDKQFEISPEELCEAIADFKPVDIDIEHVPSIMDGKLGKLEAVALGSDGWSMVGTVRIPKWLDENVLKSAERKVSATWDRVTKKLTKLALVRNPRVKDAALMAAFMANEFGDDIAGTKEDMTKTIESLIEKHLGEFAAKKTWDGNSVMQSVHDMTARAGAVCTEADTGKKFSSKPTDADFVSEAESKTIQQMHDTAVKGGATCQFMKDGSYLSYYNTDFKENEKMSFKDIKKIFQSLSDEDLEKLEAQKVEKPDFAAETKVLEDKKAEIETKEAALAETEKSLAEREEAVKVAEEALKAKEEEVVENSVPEPTEKEKELQAQLEELRNRDTVREAEKFADDEIKAGRSLPAEREAVVALFTQAVKDDSANEVKVAFKVGEETKEFNRVDALKSLFSGRKPHNLTYEAIGDADVVLGILPASMGSDDEKNYAAEADAQAKAYAKMRNAQIAKSNMAQ